MADQQEVDLPPLHNLSLNNQEPPDLVEEIWKITGYRFNNRNLLEQAFMHLSYEEKCESYERLELFGDSVLNLLITKEHFFLYPELPPGDLTMLRAANVDREKLARAALRCSLHKFLRHSKPLLVGQVEEFKDAILGYPLHSTGLIDAPKVLADIFESFIGALYIDCNFSLDMTWEIAKKMLEPMITPKTLQSHPVTRLYQLCQKNGLKLQFVDSWKDSGEVEAYVDEEFAGRGKYRSKKLIAINRAAHYACAQVERKLLAVESIDDGETDS